YIYFSIKRYYSLPPGPFPLPIVGNILSFKGNHYYDDILRNWSKKYGPVFTFYILDKPLVIITDPDMAKKAFQSKDFSGRMKTFTASIFINYTSLLYTDYGPAWEALRRVAQSAAQKYSTNEELIIVAVNSVEKIVQTMLKTEGPDKPIEPFNYIYLMFLNILANSAFGENYDMDDPEFIFLKYILRDAYEETQSNYFTRELSPIIQLMDYKTTGKQRKLMGQTIDLMIRKFNKHYTDYNPDSDRDFCDALISAKNDRLREGRESAKYLTDTNLAMTVFDLFFAGTDTSQQTFQWLLLFLAYYPLIQQKLRQEIDDTIGDQMPKHADRQRLHYTMAFISETLRYRNVAPYGLPHKAIVDCQLGNYKIPKGQTVVFYQSISLRNTDEKYWKNGLDFLPERFIDKDGRYQIAGHPAYTPFGVGRRNCLGEKLAIADLFLVLVCFLQSTRNYDIVLDDQQNGGIGLDTNLVEVSPNYYRIILKTKK
ncbi:cytochrome P450 1A1-like, partial [Oppia nitens]|uniref:cytochrome P450 1A1-like n=1 Tax=Oppia nitens TaxID=1686743 RepID=UPI0023DC937F